MKRNTTPDAANCRTRPCLKINCGTIGAFFDGVYFDEFGKQKKENTYTSSNMFVFTTVSGCSARPNSDTILMGERNKDLQYIPEGQ